MLYQGAQAVTHEDGVVAVLGKKRPEGVMGFIIPRARRCPRATTTPPAGCPAPSAGLRCGLATMNHIAAAPAPRRQTGPGILMGHSLRTLVLTNA